MIRKLRKKFILINMALIACLMLAMFLVIGVSSWRQNTQETLKAMRMQADPGMIQDGENHSKLELGDGRGDRPALVATFSVLLDDSGAVQKIQGSFIEVTQEAAEEAAQAVQKEGAQSGVLWSLRLRYLVGEDAQGNRRIVFADLSDQLSRMKKLIFTMLLVGAVAMGALLGISVFLSDLAVRPVETAWQRQRQFVADASHELKTPLTVILANSGILLSKPGETVESQRQWVENTREEAQRMRKLVDDMLFLAKSDGAKQQTPHVSVSLSDLVWNVELPFEAVAFEQGVALDCQVEEDIRVSGDEGQLRQLAGILLDNACKYAGGGGQVQMRLCRLREKACLTVHNTGTAIPPEQLEHVFERFYRVDPSRVRTQGGYGLGLAIAQSVAQSHNGTLKAASSPETGTTFTFSMAAETERSGGV